MTFKGDGSEDFWKSEAAVEQRNEAASGSYECAARSAALLMR
jgi:hypothetical protein